MCIRHENVRRKQNVSRTHTSASDIKKSIEQESVSDNKMYIGHEMCLGHKTCVLIFLQLLSQNNDEYLVTYVSVKLGKQRNACRK